MIGVAELFHVYINETLLLQPRLVPADGVLQPYASREALGQYWMKDLENGEYRKEYYVAHISQLRHTNKPNRADIHFA